MSDAMATGDFVDTSDQDEVILAIPTKLIRRDGQIAPHLARVIGNLVLGVPVAGADLDRWGITAIGMLTAEEAAARRAQYELFRPNFH